MAEEVIVVEEVIDGDRRLHLREPLRLQPYGDESGELLCADNEEYGICTHGFDREDLISAIHDDLLCTWHVIVQEDDERLSLGAQRLKADLLRNIEVRDG